MGAKYVGRELGYGSLIYKRVTRRWGINFFWLEHGSLIYGKGARIWELNL